MNRTLNILLIDDSPDDREAVSRMLAMAPTATFDVTEAESGNDALASLRRGTFDCALLDFSMPGNDGLTILNEVKLRYPDMAVVMMTGEGNERIAVEALKGGAQDYVLKSDLSPDTLCVAIEHALTRKSEEAEIIQRANYDDLTGLANRRMFNERLDHALARSGHSAALAVIFLDLDGFKAINDTHGHDVGDALLKQVAARTKRNLRAGDTVARLGGDEFVVLLENLPGDGMDSAATVVERLGDCIREEPYNIGDIDVRIGVSTGMSICPLMASNRSDLLRYADQRMYQMKQGDIETIMPQTAHA